MATSPSAHGAERLAVRLAAAVKALPRGAPTVPPALLHGRFYDGTPAVGALFTISGGQLGQHFCTASVVDSPVGDLVITAAHCLQGKQPGQVAFVPEYHRHQRALRHLDGHPGVRGRGLGLLRRTPTTTWPSWSSASRATPRRSRS